MTKQRETKTKAEEPKAEVTEPEVKTEVSVGKCKNCGSELKKFLLDSRAEKPTYFSACDNRDCGLYRVVQR